MIIDKISIVLLKLLTTVNTQLSQAKGKSDKNIFVLGRLVIMILIEDFYQFPLVVEKPLWEEAIIINEFHGKAI